MERDFGSAGGVHPQRWGRTPPAHEFAELATVIGAHHPHAAPPDWASVEHETGVQFPSDYRSFINRYGVGTFCDIRIAGPDGRAEFDLSNLIRRLIEQAETSPRARTALADPERGPIVPWAQSTDGRLFGWTTFGPDPDTWAVAVLAPNFVRVNFDELSFSTYLLHYCGHRNQLTVQFAHEPWSGSPAFTPDVPLD